MAPFVLNSCACLVVVLINRALYQHGGDLAIGAYGITNSLLMIFGMLVMGLNQGMQPIAGYNFGAKKYDRVWEVLRLTIICATILTTSAFLVSETIPMYLARLFTSDKELIELTIIGLRTCSIAFPIVGFQMVTSNLVPLLLILPGKFGMIGVFASMPIADTLSSILAFVLLRREMKRFNRQTT